MLSAVEQTRLRLSKATAASKKARLGQFLTPLETARFMAGLFPEQGPDTWRLLDAGAGIGSLSAAFLSRWESGGFHFRHLELDAFEIDPALHPDLNETFARYRSRPELKLRILGGDFIEVATDWLCGDLFSRSHPTYTHAILNPPYKKIHSHSAHRLALRQVGIETVNLYSAFVALAVALLAPGGQLVAIIPRSFCNGPYYRPFRDFILRWAAIRHLHLFDSRTQAFKDDKVLQENVIIRLERGGVQGMVRVSTSTDDRFHDLRLHEYPAERILLPYDPECFIHIPTSPERGEWADSAAIQSSLSDLGIQVSTGPVVDFRLRPHLRGMPEPGSLPLLYPAHFQGLRTVWPIPGLKKPNAIERNPETEKWLYPNGYYCVVRRFSSKEEKRRIVASVVDPSVLEHAPKLGLENHLNLFHDNRQGLPRALAYGLAVFLNTTAVDEQFRRFNGHTQVNATDLKRMHYPSRSMLLALGEWAIQQSEITQEMVDAQLEEIIK